MARVRDHAAEYQRRKELAEERGHRSVYAERQYRKEIRSEEGAEATLKLTQGRKVSDPGALQRFIREYQPGSMKREQLQDRIKDLLKTSPPFDIAPMPEGGIDFDDLDDYFSDDALYGDYGSEEGDALSDVLGGMPFDEWDEDAWDDFFESDAWYDFLDELYADK